MGFPTRRVRVTFVLLSISAMALARCVGDDSTQPTDGGNDSTTDTLAPDVAADQSAADADAEAGNPCLTSDAGGTLDQTFNTGSKSLGAFGANGATIDSAGNIYVVGIQNSGCAQAYSAAVYRFDNTGAQDTKYGGADGGGNGRVCIHYDAVDAAYVAAVDSKGRLVVGGLSYNGGSWIHATVTRLNGDGTLDTTFHGTGMLDLDPKTDGGRIGIGAVQGIGFLGSAFNDKIVITGSPEAVQVGVGKTNTGFVIRLTSDGQLDTGFAGSGIFKDTTVDGFYGVQVDSAGTITTVGSSLLVPASGDAGVRPKAFVVRRLDVGGNVVSSFGDGGVFTTPLGGNYGDDGRDVLFLGNRFYVAGSVDFLNGPYGQFGRVGVVALGAGGGLDTTWGGDDAGVLAGEFISKADFTLNQYYQITTLAAECDGKLLTGGTHLDLDAGDASNAQDLAVRRLTADGKLDPTFGNNGLARFSQVGNEVAVAVAQDPTTSRIVVVGRDSQGNTVLARFLP